MKQRRMNAVLFALLMIITGACARAEEAVQADIQLQNGQISVVGIGAQAEGTTLNITQPGTYRITGTLEEGSIVVYAGKNAAVRLILAGVDIVSKDRPAIQAVKTGTLEIELEAGTKNSLKSGETAQANASGSSADRYSN